MVKIAISNGYATLAEMRAHMRDAGTTLTEAVAERAIEAASRRIDRWCGRKFYLEAAVSTRVYRPDDPRTAWVDDIGTTTGLVVKTDTTGDLSWALTWDAADYQLEPLNSEVAGAGTDVQPYAWWRIVAVDDKHFPVGVYKPTLQVTARYGWSAVPADVKQAALILAARLYKRRDSPEGVAGFDQLGVVNVGRYDPDVAELLGPYRRIHVGAV